MESEVPTNYSLPTGFKLNQNSPLAGDTAPLSSLYRGKRYGFTQQTKYLPQIDKYVNVYKYGGKEYYGYQKVKYSSPILVQNLISNYDFKEESGWTGATLSPSSDKATVEAVYGYFDLSKREFCEAITDLSNGEYDINKQYLLQL